MSIIERQVSLYILFSAMCYYFGFLFTNVRPKLVTLTAVFKDVGMTVVCL